MNAVLCNVKDIAAADRLSLEHMVGMSLGDNQQVLIQVVTPAIPHDISAAHSELDAQLPEWCHVYDGLSDQEIAEVEAAALDRSAWVRPVIEH